MTVPPSLSGRSGGSRLGLRAGTVVVLVLLLAGFASMVWTPYPTDGVDVGNALQGPGAQHWLGTDPLGRDVLSLTMRGMLTSFVVAAVALMLGALIGGPLGLAATRWRGFAGSTILGGGALVAGFPALILAVAIAHLIGPGSPAVMLAIGILNVPAIARATREAAGLFDGADYLDAARLAGLDEIEIARRHMQSRIVPALAAQALALLGIGIVAEATLAFVGVGAQSPASSLGLVLKDAQPYAASNPLAAIIPGAIIVTAVLALNIIAARLRDDADLSPIGEASDGAA